MTDMIYKIAPNTLWQEAIALNVFNGAPVDLADGFIHFSTANQALETAAKHFAGQNDLLLIGFAAAPFGDDLKWEVSRGGALFPHLYRSFTPDEAVWIKPLPLGLDGKHVFPTEMT